MRHGATATRRACGAAVLCAAVAASLPASSRAADALAERTFPAAKDGWVALFDGTDLSGWQFGAASYGLPAESPKNGWSVRDGAIALEGNGKGNIGTQWDYVDCEMRFEWRALKPNYNSGFFVRSGRRTGANQINLAKGAEGKFFGGKLTGGPAVPQLQNPAGEWNQWHVRIVGDVVTFTCNGQAAWEGKEFGSKSGHFGLQAEGAPLEFRALEIKELGCDRFLALSDWNGATGWSMQGDAFATDGKGSALTVKDPVAGDFRLRFEWSSSAGAQGSPAVTLGEGGTPVGFGGEAAAPNEAGLWNYAEVSVADGKLAAWQNGKTFAPEATAKAAAGPLALQAGGAPVRIRNVRLFRAAK